jgi:hypothetical protein
MTLKQWLAFLYALRLAHGANARWVDVVRKVGR